MKTAFVTGASQGLGYGFVEILLERGWEVFAGTRKIDNLPQHEHLHWIELELQDDASIKKAFDKVCTQTDHLDLVINDAGINKDTATNQHMEKVSELGKLERSYLLKMFDINAVAPLLVLQTFKPLLTIGPSFVINISSCRASFHDTESTSYANYGYRASKVALNMFTFCSVKELPAHVKTFAVHPGDIISGMNPEGVQNPRDQATSILAIIETWDESFNGTFLNYDSTPYPL